VSDTRESPAHDVIQLLEGRGVDVAYHDPHVPEFETDGLAYESVPLSEEQLKACDCALILTDHDELDIGLITELAPMVFDTRNATAGVNAEHVVRL